MQMMHVSRGKCRTIMQVLERVSKFMSIEKGFARITAKIGIFHAYSLSIRTIFANQQLLQVMLCRIKDM